MKPNCGQLRELLRIVAATKPQEINCEELLARVGTYLESSEQGCELSPELEEVAQHLEVCPECREEYEALLAAHRRFPEGP